MVVKVAEVVPIQKLYARPATLCDAFDIGRAEMTKLVSEMRESIAFREHVISRPRMVLVRVDAFERFLKWRNK